jgi:hypothetical protein
LEDSFGDLEHLELFGVLLEFLDVYKDGIDALKAFFIVWALRVSLQSDLSIAIVAEGL